MAQGEGASRTGLTLRGRVVDETPEQVGIEIGQSVFDIPRDAILGLHRSEGGFAEVTIAANAQLIQRVLAPVLSGVGRGGGVMAGACDCACNCNCACNCACGGGGGGSIVERPTAGFRSQMLEAGAGA